MNSPPEFVEHPEHGRLPACRILDCVFALSPDGSILHRHVEEYAVDENANEVVYSESGSVPEESRARCQIIPPRVVEFPKVG